MSYKKHQFFENRRGESLADVALKTWMSAAEVAEYLGTTKSGVTSMVYRGLLLPRQPTGKRGK